MDDFWGATVLVCLVLAPLVAVLARAAGYYGRYRRVRFRRSSLARRAPGLKSGDLVFFIAHTHGFTNSLFTGDLFSHAGMVVRAQDGSLHLSEATHDTPSGWRGSPKGSWLSPLRRRLERYPGAAFLMPLERGLTAAQEARLRALAQSWVPYPGLAQVLRGLFLRHPVHREARHCMQHVAWLLDELGLIPDHLAGRGRGLLSTGLLGTSRAISTLAGKSLAGGANRYAEMVELVPDLGYEA